MEETHRVDDIGGFFFTILLKTRSSNYSKVACDLGDMKLSVSDHVDTGCHKQPGNTCMVETLLFAPQSRPQSKLTD